jgi:hypothetical protein
MKRICPSPLHTAVVVLSLVYAATYASAGTSKDIGVVDLRVRKGTDIIGWQDNEEAYVQFDPDKLFELINGAAPSYIDNGLVEGIFQRLEKPDSLSIEVFAEDFGSLENARTMYAHKTNIAVDSLEDAAENSAITHMTSVGGGFVTYAAIDRF